MPRSTAKKKNFKGRDMGLERRLLFGLNTDRPQPLNYVCVTLENWMSVREERHSPKKPDCPGRNKAARAGAGAAEQSYLHPALPGSEATRASAQLRPVKPVVS